MIEFVLQFNINIIIIVLPSIGFETNSSV